MKKTLLTLGSVLFCAITFAQNVPQGINYQGVARDANGTILTNHFMSLKASIYSDTVSNTLQWQEVHSVTTNDVGIFTIVIGDGLGLVTSVQTSFGDIDWNASTHYIKIELDHGSGFMDYGTTALQSVPYALAAETADEANAVDWTNINNIPADIADGDDVDDADNSTTNEIQSITLSGDTLYISGGNNVDLSGYNAGVFATDSNVTSNANGDYANDDFVFGSPTLDFDANTSDGVRMFFDKSTGAFRAGRTENTNWDTDSLGLRSFATGYRTKASGSYSTAMGYSTEATGAYSTAMGRNTEASGSNSTAMGYSTVASGHASTAMGYYTEATGAYSTAMGYYTEATGDYSTAMGRNTDATGNYSTAMGYYTEATGAYSTAMGSGTDATGSNSTAMGSNTIASGDYSTAMGYSTEATGFYSTAMGSGTDATGAYSTAMGSYTNATGFYSTAMGRSTDAMAYQLVVGTNNIISGDLTTYYSSNPLFIVGNGASTSWRSNALVLYGSGNLTISGTLTQSSDIRLKTNITPMGNVLAALEFITPITYEFKDTQTHPEGLQIGFSAQEIKAQFPELVREDESGNLSVAYGHMSAVLLQAIKEMQQDYQSQIDELHKEINILKTK